ncbi:nucleotidyltransferase domain-containing protein [Nonomuraea sp. CA-141351]|uniref:nucleotidyltransferase domain-containing protein n=1 Tax=Nonomuraea sp. CA-141351 TaxID=3239996 RepID=UPI003D923B72
MTDDATTCLLDRFIAAIRPVVPLVSMWAHGSLAGGDYQPTRSDLDLVAVLGRPCTEQEEQRIAEVHEDLGGTIPLAWLQRPDHGFLSGTLHAPSGSESPVVIVRSGMDF